MLYFILGNFMLEYVKKYVFLRDLDEWDYDAIQHTLDMAIMSKANIKVKLWRDGAFSYNRGTIESIDLKRRI